MTQLGSEGPHEESRVEVKATCAKLKCQVACAMCCLAAEPMLAQTLADVRAQATALLQVVATLEQVAAALQGREK